MDYELISTPNV